MTVEFNRLSAPALASLPREQTVFFFPVGPIEPHGPHLPIGIDLMEAERSCAELARIVEQKCAGWRSVIMPSVPLGIDSSTAGPLRITVRAHVLRDWLVDACRSLNRDGFRYFVCYSGHPGPRQLTAIEEVSRLLRSPRHWLNRDTRPVFVSASSLLVDRKEALRSPMVFEPSEHAGAGDTSIGLHLCPTEVSQLYQGLPEQEKGGAGMLWRFQQRMSGAPSQYWGKPSEASAETGERLLNERVERIAGELIPVLRGAKPVRFRTVYRFFPSNRSFFKAWLIFFAALLVMIYWTIVFMNGLMG